jgi:hypothetical protein
MLSYVDFLHSPRTRRQIANTTHPFSLFASRRPMRFPTELLRKSTLLSFFNPKANKLTILRAVLSCPRSSLISFTARQRHIGEAAKTAETSNFKNTIGSLKRLIGRRFDDPGKLKCPEAVKN